MISHTVHRTFDTARRREFIRITDDVADAVRESAITWAEPANDLARELSPDPGDYRRHRGGEDNGDAHFKNLLVHHQVIVPASDGALDLGPWQQVFDCEFDGGRRTRLVIKALGEERPSPRR